MSESKILLSVGRFIHCKGYDILLEAAKSIPSDIGIYIVGGEPTEEYLKYVNKYGLQNVHFIGFKDKSNLKKWYLASDVFVLPTRGDVWGLVVNEAMANALPIITTDMCGAGLELVENGKNGYIVPSENPSSLSDAVTQIFANESLLSDMKLSCLEKIRNYTVEQMAMSHVNYFKNKT